MYLILSFVSYSIFMRECSAFLDGLRVDSMHVLLISEFAWANLRKFRSGDLSQIVLT